MRKKSIITIAIPAYKRPKELDECIGSIVNQKEFVMNNNLKILVIDDSPGHEGRKIMKRYVRMYPQRIRYISNKKNLGFELNILKLIKEIKKDYIFFVTDDDKLRENSLKEILDVINKFNPDLIVSSYLNEYSNGSAKINSLFSMNFMVDNDDLEIKSKIFSDSHILSGKIFKRDQIDTDGYVKHIGSLYPHMYPVGKCLLKAATYYSSKPFIVHRVGNKVYWNYLDDYMVVGKMRIIDDLSLINDQFGKLARRNLLREFAYIIYLNIFRPKKIHLFLKGVLSGSSLLHSWYDWLNVLWGGICLLLNKLKFVKNNLLY